MRRLDLASLHFDATSEASCVVPVDVEPFVFGGSEYVVDGGVVSLEIEASRVGSRLTLKGGGIALLRGECQRCLGDAALEIPFTCEDHVDDGVSEFDDEPYVVGGTLDTQRWVRDALATAMPHQLLCRDECRGICPDCGADLNLADPDHAH
jgi:uncharacterized protein